MVTAEAKVFADGGTNYEMVSVKLHDSNALIYRNAAGENVSFHYDQLSISDKLGSIPREIILPNKTLMIIDSDPLVDAWLSGGKKDISSWEKSPKVVVGSIIAVPITLYFIFAIIIPKMAVVFAPYVPDAIVELSSKHTIAALDDTVLNPSEIDVEKTLALEEQWYELISNLDLKHTNYTILFRNTKMMGPNAFALPNGTIVFTDQLIELVDFDEEILTAIFMHEIGHVENHHSMRLVSQTLATSIALTYIFGDVSGFLDFFASVSNTIATNQFTQKLEWEADNFALAQLKATGKDPVAFARGMKKFAEYGKSNGKSSQISDDLEKILSSHPLTKERIANALEFAGVSDQVFAGIEEEINSKKEALEAKKALELPADPEQLESESASDSRQKI